ncbi:hypothetical protein [Methylobacterium sp. J-077]|uniref:hypothetical protein n=1 Tax=Methylobacterium sp. J-077 TaxID=2836656 RepID=UPI001FB95E25|nr:hypothetical protein [Methylobacterium sp. J-077]MCJ2126350.1 hypothetical protein [Methylobacterium sp. J-077]
MFALVRFNRSLRRAGIVELTEQYLEAPAFRHDCLIANIGHDPEPEAFPGFPGPASGDDPHESVDTEEAAAKASLNDPAEIAFLYRHYLDSLKRALDVMTGLDLGFAMKNYHWFFLAPEADLPERMLAVDPDAFIERSLNEMTGGRDVIEATALDAYRTAFRDPAVRHAICEDYRAAMTEDLALDRADQEAGRRLSCPVLVLWPGDDSGQDRPTPVEIWRR